MKGANPVPPKTINRPSSSKTIMMGVSRHFLTNVSKALFGSMALWLNRFMTTEVTTVKPASNPYLYASGGTPAGDSSYTIGRLLLIHLLVIGQVGQAAITTIFKSQDWRSLQEQSIVVM